jgi:hypothetical protein
MKRQTAAIVIGVTVRRDWFARLVAIETAAEATKLSELSEKAGGR